MTGSSIQQRSELPRALLVALLGIALSGAASAQTAAWRPDKNVEIIVGTSPGGGQDTSARLVQRIIQDNKFTAVPTAVVNKPGGGSAVGYTYLNQHPGDAHFIMLLTVPLLTNHILKLSPVAPSDLTPLAIVFDEYIVATVVPGSPLKSGKDLLDRLRKDPASLSIGVPSLTGGGNFAIVLAARAAGVDPRKLKTVVFKSGGDSMTALLGGHIDVMMSTTAAPILQRRSGKVRLLTVAAARRLPGELADVPTWHENGVNVVFSNWRGIVGPRGLSAAQIAYWDGVFSRVVATEEFKRDLEQNHLVPNYLRSEEMRRYMAAQYDELKVVLTELGMVK